MSNIFLRTYRKSIRWINYLINTNKSKRKIFCIGLHKTGTSSLYNLAKEYTYKAIHSQDWAYKSTTIENFDFLCDGGSHFDNENEFDFEFLFSRYPDSLFILQTRDTKKWIISKLKHAGWNENTIVMPNDKHKIIHSDWTYKSYLTIEKFIEHKYNYEKKVVNFFEKNDPSRLLIVDITDKKIQFRELKKLINYLNIRSISKVVLPHRNKARSGANLSKETLRLIDELVTDCNKFHSAKRECS